MRVLSFILKAVAPYRLYLLGMALTIVGVAAYTNFQGYFVKLMIDAIASHTYNELIILAIWYGALQFSIVLIWTVYDFLVLKTNGMRCHIANTMLDKIKHYDITFFQNNFGGSLSSKIKDAATLIPSTVYLAIDNYLQLILVILISVVLLSTIHWGFAVALLLWVATFALLFYKKIKVVNVISVETAESDSKIWGRIVDYIGNIMAVKYYAANKHERQVLEVSQREYLHHANRRGYYLLRCYFGMGVAFWFYIMGCLSFLIYLYHGNRITPGDFAFVFSINYNIIDQLFYTTHTLRDLITSWGAIDKAAEVLEAIPTVQDTLNAKELKVSLGKIEFKNVSFHYAGSELLFKNESITINPKEKVGLIGYSGSGKSSFVNLILRLYDVSQGSICIDDQDIKEVTQDSLRSAIGMIPQDPSLFNRSMIDNIRYSRIESSDDEVISVAKKSHAHEFILQLSDGYNTQVGERGLKLSGGQRQRIAIARTMLKNAPILILDEATSQLDSLTEAEIQKSLLSLMEGKTSIVVAHRLSTLLHMDRILVFDKGKIVEDGSHEVLLEKGGLYKALWEAQAKGKIQI